MANLDPRIFPLLELLSEAGLEWLLEEIVLAIARAPQLIEPVERLPLRVDDLLVGRSPDRSGRTRSSSIGASSGTGPDVGAPAEGNGQLRWAVDYIGRRLSDELKYADTASKNIVELFDTKLDDTSIEKIDGGKPSIVWVMREEPPDATSSSLVSGSEGRQNFVPDDRIMEKASLDDASGAQIELEQFVQALERWAAERDD